MSRRVAAVEVYEELVPTLPENKLYAKVLARAIQDFFQNYGGTTKDISFNTAVDARLWFQGVRKNEPITFAMVCDVLEIDRKRFFAKLVQIARESDNEKKDEVVRAAVYLQRSFAW